MEKIVIVAYRPLKGKSDDLEKLVVTHWSRLNAEGLVSQRIPVMGKAKDGSIIEIFGWKSEDAIELAHTNPVVQQLWKEFAEVCEYIPIGDIEEAGKLFSEFTPL